MPNDPTVPLAGLPSTDTPTIARVSPATPESATALTPGTILASRYRIVALLGQGGMGSVYRADDLRLGQAVALKFVSVGDQLSVERLYHEVRVGRQVSHPNVCRLHDIVEADGIRFIAMEYVDGEDLSSLLHRIDRLPAAKALQVAREVAAGLAAAHDRGVVHRDLKPANVMLDGSGHAHITDFGLASLAGMSERGISGTPAYMAPEQLKGAPPTPQTDVYAFGLLLHELFTGERVYGDSQSLTARLQQPARMPPRASSIVKDVDPAIDRLIAACLAAEPADRPASAREVLARLPGHDALDVALAAGETPSPEMVAAANESGTLPRRVAYPLMGAVLAGLLLVAWQCRTYLYNEMRKPPEVLADRAETIIGESGGDHVYLFDYDHDFFETKKGWRADTRAHLAARRPGIVRFIYRRSPERLIPKRIADTLSSIFIFTSGRVAIDDPPLDVPGSATVVLDQNASLVEYRAWPASKGGAADWTPLLQATGVELKSITPADPSATPPVASDGRRAWTAAYPDGQRARIEAASLNGRPAWLRVLGPWNPGDQPVSPAPSGTISAMVQLCISVGSLIVCAFVARRRLRGGRTDRRGAVRLALFVGSVLLLAWLIGAHHATNGEDESRMLAMGAGEAAAAAVILWLFYLTIEPDVRRRWPRALIGWTRLLAGRFDDPMIGREVLLGIGGGIVWVLAVWFVNQAPAWFGRHPYHLVHASTLDPIGRFVSDRLILQVDSVDIAIGCLFLLLFLRVALRNQWVASAVWLTVAGLAGSAVRGVALFMILLLIALLRSGLLTAAALGSVSGLLFQAPLTLDTSSWIFPRSAVILLLVGGTALWATRTATRERGLSPSP